MNNSVLLHWHTGSCKVCRFNQIPVVSSTSCQKLTSDVPVCVWERPPPLPSCASRLLLGWTEASPGNDRSNNLIINRKQLKWEAAELWRSYIYLLISLGGHGQVEPVENIVDLLALHLGLDTTGEEPVAGLTNTGPWATTSNILYSVSQHLQGSERVWRLRHLTSFLTCMTPSSVRVLVSITEIPSAERSAKIFWQQTKMWAWRQDNPVTLVLIVRK